VSTKAWRPGNPSVGFRSPPLSVEIINLCNPWPVMQNSPVTMANFTMDSVFRPRVRRRGSQATNASRPHLR
jgi:hypothetical protein